MVVYAIILMSGDPLSQRTAQLDKAEREHLEAVVTDMRERVEDNVRFQLTQRGLDEEPAKRGSSDDDAGARADESALGDAREEETRQLVEAIELEAVDDEPWTEAFEKYVTGVGYTIVNRLAALRSMEVRDFIDLEVTVFKPNGLTPAAEPLTDGTIDFLLEDEAILQAYHDACDDLAEEIEILFDRDSAYSLVDPDDDTFEELCGMLDEIPDAVWRADDVLGWVYEYYNVKLLDDLRRKGDREGLDPEDVPPANQFYTPHWVVRMLTDNSLGKLYLEHTGELGDVVETQEALSPDERKNRPLSPDESPGIADFCTYLVPSEEEGDSTDFDHPEELRVIDPACGSGHFLLYAFDVLERIWRAETDLPADEIPRKILEHNLYGVDLDMRACQLAAFNLYLKGRTRTEAEGADGFDMPDLGIVCADASVAAVEGAEDVFDEIADGQTDVENALRRILDAFEETHGLGSLLDVQGTLGDLFEDDADVGGTQITLNDDPRESHTLGQVLGSLREAIDEHHDGDSFVTQNLRSFVRLLDILAQDYDVALMNPPYGAQNKMPEQVREYVQQRYEYPAEFYVNFFEVGETLVSESGRVGMLIPHTFMFKNTFQRFREDFVGDQGGFDFLAEFGYGILDNAMVGTVGTVVRVGTNEQDVGTFLRLHDVDTYEKEATFLESVFDADRETDVRRLFNVAYSEFRQIPRTPLCYSLPAPVRRLHETDAKLDPDAARIDGERVGTAAKGMDTNDNQRFIRNHWEVDADRRYIPYAKGGTDAWILPRVSTSLNWNEGGDELRRAGALLKNEDCFGRSGLTWTYVKRTGRRFGLFPAGGSFDGTGCMFFSDALSNWQLMSILNSSLYHALFLSLTVERHWQVGDVGRIPWLEELEDVPDLSDRARDQFEIMLSGEIHDPTSPHYAGPALLPVEYPDDTLYSHSHVEKISEEIDVETPERPADLTVTEAAREAEREQLRNRRHIERIAESIDETIFDTMSIRTETRTEIHQEIFLRTSEDPEDRDVPDPDSVPEVPDTLAEQVKDLIHHFAMEVVRDEPDGIVPVDSRDAATMHDRIVERFEEVYKEYAADRLAEIDEILGSLPADEEAYPNLRRFINDDLFDYHVSRMENTPIVWELTSERLVADADDAADAGFACFLDYHSLDGGLFDRLTNTYLDPRKAELRERRSAADRRRGDDSLSASERAAATEEYGFCTSGLHQIEELETAIADLASDAPRDFDDADRDRATELKADVAQFREDTQARLTALDRLYEIKDDEWFEDTFSPTFWESVQEEREEWVGALEDLEAACDAYAAASDEPVEAHLADLFDYFDQLKGSDHYSSNGILFLTYYFGREAEPFLDERGRPRDGLPGEDAELLATLGADLESYKQLAEEIGDDCTRIKKRLSSDWVDRALSEITTAGYRPNRKHGVEINITPLAEADIVPKTVDDKVI